MLLKKPLKTSEHLSWCRAVSNYRIGYADLRYVHTYVVQKDAYREVVNTNPGFWTLWFSPHTACMTLVKSFPLVSLRQNHLCAITSVKCTLSPRVQRNSTSLNRCAPLRLLLHYSRPRVPEEVYMAAFVKNLRYKPLFIFFLQATSPHQSQHSTVDVGQLHDPQTYTQHAIQVQHIQVTEPSPATQSSSQVFPSPLQETLSLAACSAGMLHVLMQGVVFSLSFKGPHVRSDSHIEIIRQCPDVSGYMGVFCCGFVWVFVVWGFFFSPVVQRRDKWLETDTFAA